MSCPGKLFQHNEWRLQVNNTKAS